MSNELDGLCQDCFRYPKVQDKIKEYEQYYDSDMEIRKGLIDRIKRLEKEIAELEAKLEMYENGVYFSSENDKLQERIDKAIEYINNNCFLPTTTNEYIFSPKYLMNILQGSDKE